MKPGYLHASLASMAATMVLFTPMPTLAEVETTAETGKQAPKVEATEADQLFLDALKGVFPLDAGEISEIRTKQSQVEAAATRTPVATILSESRPLMLEPGKVSAPVVLTPGYVGAVVFLDVTGAPWPVSRAVLGNETLFTLIGEGTAGVPGEAQESGDNHILYVTPQREHANSNILVHLQDATSPVIVQLVSAPSTQSNRKHDGIVTFMVSARGPNAKPPIFEGVSPTISATMMSVLDGIPPDGALPLKISPDMVGVNVWKVGHQFFLRTPHTLIWPAYKAYAETTGIYVYEMPEVPSLLVSKDGRATSITIEE